jgi:peptidoglycan/LPS O-acetylase OafA/YrhL
MKRFITLDFFRGVAAIFILARHSLEFIGVNPYTSYLAVDLFYLISGFVFVPSTGDKLIGGKTDAKGVIINRIIRLYPLYFASIVFAGIFYLIGARHGINIPNQPYWQAWLIALTMGPNINAPWFMFQINGPAWYLFVDMVGVIFFAFTYKYFKDWMLGIIIALSAGVLVYAAYNIDPRGGLDLGWVKTNLQYGFARFTFSFTLGMLLYRKLRNGFFEKQYNLPFVGIILCAIMATSLCIQRIDNDTDALISLICVFGVFPAILIIGTKVDFGGFLAKISDFLSPISYTIYILQLPFITLAHYICKQNHIRASSTAPWGEFVLLAVMITISVLLNKYYDAPVRAFLNKHFKPKPKAT